jgi:hypothetical protein
MKLYRGDCLCNTGTLPGRYRLDGIRSKTFGIGDPAYINREGFTIITPPILYLFLKIVTERFTGFLNAAN